eukprot:5507870-Karenia_brevis.AAC.1
MRKGQKNAQAKLLLPSLACKCSPGSSAHMNYKICLYCTALIWCNPSQLVGVCNSGRTLATSGGAALASCSSARDVPP